MLKLNSKRSRYIGMDWQSKLHPFAIAPNDSLICCDLRGCIFDKLDLSGCEFFGCRLNGTSFQGANLYETKFIGCFSDEADRPTDFRNAIGTNLSVEFSHINFLSEEHQPNFSNSFWDDGLILGDFFQDDMKWPSEVAKAAADTLSERNDVRYNATVKMGELDNPVVAPLLGCLLADREWDVRAIALEVLGKLRHQKFWYGDEVLLEWMFLCLGDRHSIVRQTAIELVETISPPDRVLLTSINRMVVGASDEERLAGLLAAIELCQLDDDYVNLCDRQVIDSLLLDGGSEIRSESSRLFEIIRDR
ncbi:MULTISPECIES: pentapeptide repeat-containing protein [unclassified Microcoleus]|uniref:pentapeptide repeat-containing protein n=1 Tax=unclassified Microcoleus TaxID=2642155 RepID=UPI0025DB041C|nr:MULTISPECIES: pentapeptide repeat-containing protein [unclassified Microcoleus]